MEPSEQRHAVGTGRLMVVDDTDLHRRYALALLERAGHVVDVARNGAEAVALHDRDGPYDLILMDLYMPVMDGFAAIAAIRAREADRGGAVPIIASSTLMGRREVELAVTAGADAHVVKPYGPTCLEEAVTIALGHRREQAATHPDGPIWDRRVFEALVSRLGAERITNQLARVRARLANASAAITSPGVDPEIVAREAHDLISSAGVLGFEHLLDSCRRAQTVAAARHDPGSLKRLRAAIELSVAEIERQDTVTKQSAFPAPSGVVRQARAPERGGVSGLHRSTPK